MIQTTGGIGIVAKEDSSKMERDPETGRVPGRFVNYAFWGTNTHSACRYYRIDVPFRGLSQINVADSVIDTSGKNEDSLGLMLEADVNLWYAQGGSGPTKMVEYVRNKGMENIKKHFPKYIPPAMIFDIDDNLDWVHPMNPAFGHLGTRTLDGTIVGPGESVVTKDIDGSDIVLWEDRKTPTLDGNAFYDVRRNNAIIDSNRHFAANIATGMTVPSPYLAEYVKEQWGVKNVYVYPNSIVPEDWFLDYDISGPYKDKVTILWQGGDSHYHDLMVIRDAMGEVAKKYPQAYFIFWGAPFPYIFKAIPEGQWKHVEWVQYQAYKLQRTMMRSDINICPLVDNEFNRSKSAIKWYEASILKNPEATLAQRTSPYKDEIEDGKTGLLYDGPDDFVSKLSALIENAELRKTLGENARKQVLETRHYEKTAKGLFEFYSECKARVRFGLEE